MESGCSENLAYLPLRMTYLHDVRMCIALTEFTENQSIIVTYPGESILPKWIYRILYRLAEVDQQVN